MRDHSTILRTAIVRTDTPNHNSISTRTPTTINTIRQDRELEVRSRAEEGKAFVVVVLMWVLVSTDCLARSVVGKCCGGSIIDILLAVGGS
jgi:hypothetical protein